MRRAGTHASSKRRATRVRGKTTGAHADGKCSPSANRHFAAVSIAQATSSLSSRFPFLVVVVVVVVVVDMVATGRCWLMWVRRWARRVARVVGRGVAGTREVRASKEGGGEEDEGITGLIHVRL